MDTIFKIDLILRSIYKIDVWKMARRDVSTKKNKDVEARRLRHSRLKINELPLSL